MPRQLRSSNKPISSNPYTKPADYTKSSNSKSTAQTSALIPDPPPPSAPPGRKKTVAVVTPESESLLFHSPSEFNNWLATNLSLGHTSFAGHWLRLAKKSCPMPDLTYDQALPIALSHGWIDGQRKSLPDEQHYYIQRFTPRRKNSLWSKRNVGIAEGLMAEGDMTERGMREVDAAKEDGRWERAYSGGKDIQVPVDFERLLKEHGEAWKTWEGLRRGERYPMLLRLETMRSMEGRERKMRELVGMLAEGKTMQ